MKLTFALPHQAIMSDATVSFFLIFRATENAHSLMSFFGCVEFQISDLYTYIQVDLVNLPGCAGSYGITGLVGHTPNVSQLMPGVSFCFFLLTLSLNLNLFEY